MTENDTHSSAPGGPIELIRFNDQETVEQRLPSVAELAAASPPDAITWINIDVADNESLIHDLGNHFNLHPLAIEDVLHFRQRAKVEEYDGYLFIVVRMASIEEDQLVTEQLALFLLPSVVLSFQEGRPGDCLGSVRERLRQKTSPLRRRGADYLVYALIDAAIDSYFGPLEHFGDRLDHLEELIDEDERVRVDSQLHWLRRNLLAIRRAVWPFRDAIAGLLRSGHPLITSETQIHLRDCADHGSQLVDLAETYREVCADLRELNLTKLSQRTNEVMRVLTIIATIFMPLSFIAGLYGMNFNTSVSEANMPELNWRWGYPFALTLMALVSATMLWTFRRWGWLAPHTKLDSSHSDR